jgi:hypothetical protein
MRTLATITFVTATIITTPAAIIEFDLSPPGTDSGIGLHRLNEVIPGPSTGSGDETGAGIFFDTSTRLLTLNLGYGTAFGFTDLTGPAFSWLLHGPSPASETAPALFNLQMFHTFAPNPAQGGQITGSLVLDSSQEATLLSGLSYINIYTPANLGGELRGQLVVVPEPAVMTLFFGIGVSAMLWRRATKRWRRLR